jgi:hypothetical protein
MSSSGLWLYSLTFTQASGYTYQMTITPSSLFQLTHRKRGDILYFEVSGDIDSQEVRIAYWQQIAAITEQKGMRKILVIDRKKHKPALPSELAALTVIMQSHASLVDQIALIEPNPQFISALEHVEIHGRELGINIRVFNDTKNAERWLIYGSYDDA